MICIAVISGLISSKTFRYSPAVIAELYRNEELWSVDDYKNLLLLLKLNHNVRNFSQL